MFRKFYILIFSAVLVNAAQSSHRKFDLNDPTVEKYKNYTVKSGDTIFSIAKKFKVSMSDIKKLNRLKSGNNKIYPGNVLKIPTRSYIEKAKKAILNQKKSVYRVKRGDTLNSIARDFNMKVDDLLTINNISRSKTLKPGMEINVFAKKETIERRKKVSKVVVRKGDTLWSIAKRYNVSVEKLRALNPKLRVQGLKVGAILNISGKSSERNVNRTKVSIKIADSRNGERKKLQGRLAQYKKNQSIKVIRYKNRNRVGNGARVVRYAKRFLGTPYVWGATSGRAFDCSGFTQYVFRKVKGKSIPRVSRRQAYYGIYVPRRKLIAGDLVFFDTSRRRRGYVNHVGIYIGHNKFIHASSAKHRVVITSLNKPFYSQRFMWGRRIN